MKLSDFITTIKRAIKRGVCFVYEVADDNNRVKRKKYYPQEIQSASQRDTIPYKVIKSRLRKGNRHLFIEWTDKNGVKQNCWVESKQVPVM